MAGAPSAQQGGQCSCWMDSWESAGQLSGSSPLCAALAAVSQVPVAPDGNPSGSLAHVLSHSGAGRWPGWGLQNQRGTCCWDLCHCVSRVAESPQPCLVLVSTPFVPKFLVSLCCPDQGTVF